MKELEPWQKKKFVKAFDELQRINGKDMPPKWVTLQLVIEANPASDVADTAWHFAHNGLDYRAIQNFLEALRTFLEKPDVRNSPPGVKL